jgi:hypothetical protein
MRTQRRACMHVRRHRHPKTQTRTDARAHARKHTLQGTRRHLGTLGVPRRGVGFSRISDTPTRMGANDRACKSTQTSPQQCPRATNSALCACTAASRGVAHPHEHTRTLTLPRARTLTRAHVHTLAHTRGQRARGGAAHPSHTTHGYSSGTLGYPHKGVGIFAHIGHADAHARKRRRT